MNIVKRFFENIDQIIYSKQEFVVVSNNCWGGEIYKRLGLQYNTPFIGLYITSKHYIKLLENFDFYMKSELVFISNFESETSKLKYPIGYLGEIEIHFLHYSSEEEAIEKWNRSII